ncbi:AI-2E family transporter [Candidatus Pacearchaeota archaeon]|nr:AI-2E family transporter [Candidatus Pacearchaeota archaeon]
MFTKPNFKNLIILLLTIGIFILAIIVIKPIIIPIIYGLLLAYIFSPVYKFLLKKLKNKNLTAGIICLGLLIILLGISILIFQHLFDQIINFYINIQKIDFTKIAEQMLPEFISSSEISTTVSGYLNNYISTLIETFLKMFKEFIFDLPVIILKLFIVIFIFFFSLRDGDKAIEFIKSLSPLKKETEDRFFNHLKEITNLVLLGQIVVGIVQGLTAGIGYFIFGVPNALLLTSITMITAIIPIIGAWIIWIPVVIFLFATGNSGAGIGLLIYGIIIVSTIDNIIRFLIVSKRTKLNSVIVLLGMIGGLFTFGFLGLIIGPLSLAYVLLIAELYVKNSLKDGLIFEKENKE